MKLKQKNSHTRQEFLLTFFNPQEKYETREVNGYILLKHPNGNTGGSEVAIFTKESYKKYFEYKKGVATQMTTPSDKPTAS